MTSKNLKSAIWLTLAVSATALAAGGPPPGKGGGGGGGGGEETLSNNLSVPTILVGGGSFTGVTCGQANAWSALVPPTGAPLDGYEVDGYFYVQGVHKWQAQCSNYTTTGLLVDGAWGDNLSGDAKLKVGSPIRVELVLSDATSDVPMYEGYTVVKLETSKLDRESAYGTLASGVVGNFSATPTAMIPGVYDGQARLKIEKVGGSTVVEEHLVKPEINAGGRVVYGYNLRVTAAGQYLITFTMPSVTFDGCDAGTCEGSTASLPITVIAGGGGGGGKGKPTK
jgi:hypothetical protein